MTHCIKFKDRHDGNNFPKADFDFLNEWLRKEFKEGVLEYWIFDSEDGRKEHYLRTGNSLSLVFIYYVLHKYNEKGLLKNPSLKSQEDKAVYRVEVNRRIKQQYCEATKTFLAIEE